ncbi:MAG TPA: MEDS domain-containing protein [Pyrinomonadaceae bacterium]|nr:MEDS domain-containing protein [Pyrinomonadaceae bacterium]
MAPELRSTGISLVGDVPWGTHFCAFYERKQDLLDILIPFFKTGLKNNEFCLWIISNSELLTMQEARNALQEVLPDLDRYMGEKSIEFAGHDWFLNGGSFDFRRVANRFKEKVDEALARGYVGMRVTGSPSWLETSNPKELRSFEAEVDQLYPHERIIASCTYPIGSSRADFLLDVARNHRFAIARRHGIWDIVETPELAQAKAEIERLNAELEQRVIERTKKLEATTARLRAEIEERKEAEEALRQSQERFAAFMDNMPGYAWMKDLEGRYVYINETFLQLRNAVGKTDAELWPAEIASTYRANDNQVIQTKNALQTIEPFPKDPEQGCQIVSKFPILDQDGAVVMVGGASVDITERIEAEAALRESEERFRELAENIDEVFWLSDLKQTTIFYVSPAYEKLWGRSCNSLYALPRSWMDAIHPEDRQRVVEILDDHELQSAPNMVYRIIRPDDSTRWVHARGFPVHDENGAVVRVAGIAADITERKHAEEQLKATSEQLRALSASVQSAREEESKRIAREIHDELGGALTSSKWDLEEIREIVSEPMDSSQVAALQTKIDGMIELTGTTLDTVRRLASELRPMALELGLAEAIEWQALQFENRTGIAVKLERPLNKIDLSNEQSTAIFRILQEALTNILRHAKATKVSIVAREESGQFLMSIKDNGRGISESQKSGPQSLGLLGMRERAHLVGGETKIASTEGKGTEVTVRVPLSTSQLFGSVLQTDG